MCEGLGGYFCKDFSIFFSEPDWDGDCSHEVTRQRKGWKDDKTFTSPRRKWECPDWTIESFRWDEDETLPGWVDTEEAKSRVARIIPRVKKVWEEYRLDIEPAGEEFNAVLKLAWEEYQAVVNPAWEEFNAGKRVALKEYLAGKAEYGACEKSAQKKYNVTARPARKKYNTVAEIALEKYLAVEKVAREKMVAALKKIKGYVPEVKR